MSSSENPRKCSALSGGPKGDLERNLAEWTKANAEFTHGSAARAWAREEITWGKWGGVESELNVLGDVADKDVIELGCGTAYFSAWLAKRGAPVVGVDPTPAQLDTARRTSRPSGHRTGPRWRFG